MGLSVSDSHTVNNRLFCQFLKIYLYPQTQDG